MYTADRVVKHGNTYRNAALSDFEKKFDERWLPFHSFEGEKTLFHYTTAVKLKGIVSSRSLFCSDTRFINDSQEVSYGIDLAHTIIEDLQEEYSESKHVREYVLGELQNQLSHFPGDLFKPFIACFCESSDLLSQWRGYANTGGGYALGFYFCNQTKIVQDETAELKPRLRKVIYDECAQRELLLSRAEKEHYESLAM